MRFQPGHARWIAVATGVAALAFPASAGAFHHGSIPARECAASDMASNNPTALAQIRDRNPVQNPGTTFPPFETPGEGQGNAHVQCAGAE